MPPTHKPLNLRSPNFGALFFMFYFVAACGDSVDGGQSTTDDASTSDDASTAIGDASTTPGSTTDSTAPAVLSTIPRDAAVDVAANRGIRASFSEAMDPGTLTTTSFTVVGPANAAVAGTITYSGTRAHFMPTADLALDSLFQVTVTTDAADLAGNALAGNFEWIFTTSAEAASGPAPVLLGMAGDFAILAKSGIDTVPASAVTGNVGVSPIDSTGLTGFSLAVDASLAFATSDQVTGKVFAPDYASPTPADLTVAIGHMETAYTDAAGRTTPDFTELGAGEIGGLVLVPGLYKWGTGVTISTDVTLDGGPNDVWIFQIAGDLTQASATSVTLSGGASPHNIFWQAFGQVMVGTTAHFEGIVLCQTAIVFETGASVDGRLLAQTAVTLDQNAVAEPTRSSL